MQLSDIEKLAHTNFTILFTQYSRGLSKVNESLQNYQIKDNKHEIAEFLTKIEDSLVNRIMISTGIWFKSQMMQSGGDGYTSIFEYLTENNYIEKINPDILKAVFCDNPKRIFR